MSATGVAVVVVLWLVLVVSLGAKHVRPALEYLVAPFRGDGEAERIRVALTEYEARALARTAELFSGALSDEGIGCDCHVAPLEAAAMKLEMALVCEGCEL